MKHGVKLAVIVLIAVLIVGIGAGIRNGIAGPISDGTGSIKQPIQKAATALADWFEGIYGYLYEYDQLIEENNALHAELAELQQRARDYDEINEENQRLRELLNLRDKHTDFVYESSKIVSWDSSNYTSAFTISKGSDMGIEVGDSVVTEYGALVGQVTELGSSWATVRTIIDVNTSVGALVGTNSYAGMATGDYTLMLDGNCRMGYLASSAQIFEGDEVLTSGKGGNFPAGLLIGKVIAVMTEAGGQTTYGVIEPACALDSLSQIFVIKDFDITE